MERVVFELDIQTQDALVGIEQLKAKLKDQRADLRKVEDTGSEAYRNKAKEMLRTQHELKQLQKSTRQQIRTQEEAATGTENMRTRLTKLRQEMQRMAVAGDTSSDEFVRMRDEAAGLQDNIDSVQAQIKFFSDDMAIIRGVTEAMTGMAGAMQAAQGIVGALGFESEKYEETMQRMMAAMQVANGLERVSNMLRKEAAFTLLAKAAAGKVATAVQWAWNAAVTANPIGVIIMLVAGLIGGLGF